MGQAGRGHRKGELQVQLSACEHTSSKKAVLESVFKAGNGAGNLHTALDKYEEQIEEIQGMHLK